MLGERSGCGGRFAAFGGTSSRDDISVAAEITDGCKKFGVIFGIGGREKEKVREIGAKEEREFGGKGGQG